MQLLDVELEVLDEPADPVASAPGHAAVVDNPDHAAGSPVVLDTVVVDASNGDDCCY